MKRRAWASCAVGLTSVILALTPGVASVVAEELTPAPEFSHERQTDSVERYVRQSHIPYPVVIDNDFTVWKRYGAQAWPTMYLVDKRGMVRHVQVGEGRYADTERRIQALLAEP